MERWAAYRWTPPAQAPRSDGAGRVSERRSTVAPSGEFIAPHLGRALIGAALSGQHMAPGGQYRTVVAAVLRLDRDAIARYASRWQALSQDDRLDVVADWSAAFGAENRWHNGYSPILDDVAYEEWFRAVETFEAVLARMDRLGLPVPEDRIDAFASDLWSLQCNPTWPPERRAAFAATLAGDPDAYAALVALVSAAILSDTRDPSLASVYAVPFGWPRDARA